MSTNPCDGSVVRKTEGAWQRRRREERPGRRKKEQSASLIQDEELERCEQHRVESRAEGGQRKVRVGTVIIG